MVLSELKDGQFGVISSVKHDAAFERRLMDMGFCPGERVLRLGSGLGGGLLLFRVKGSMVALRKEDARGIEVRP